MSFKQTDVPRFVRVKDILTPSDKYVRVVVEVIYGEGDTGEQIGQPSEPGETNLRECDFHISEKEKVNRLKGSDSDREFRKEEMQKWADEHGGAFDLELFLTDQMG